MRTQKVISEMFKCGGYYTVGRAGQEDPDKSDMIVVEARMFLPSKEDRYDICLAEPLRFGSRVEILKFE